MLLGFLAGCAGADILTVALIPPPDPEPWRKGKNHYEPMILASSKNMIRIKYLSVGPNAEHEHVKQLILDHCHGAYVETSREELRGYNTIEAECIHNPVLLRESSAKGTYAGITKN